MAAARRRKKAAPKNPTGPAPIKVGELAGLTGLSHPTIRKFFAHLGDGKGNYHRKGVQAIIQAALEKWQSSQDSEADDPKVEQARLYRLKADLMAGQLHNAGLCDSMASAAFGAIRANRLQRKGRISERVKLTNEVAKAIDEAIEVEIAQEALIIKTAMEERRQHLNSPDPDADDGEEGDEG